MKHIGILAHSFEGATLCFHEACLEGTRQLGAHMHPEITMTCSPMALVLDAWERGDNKELRAFFRKDAEKLAAAGADFFACPDNTAHIALESDRRALPDSWPAHRRSCRGAGSSGRPPQDRHPRHQIYDDRPGLSRRARPARPWLGVPDEADRKTVNDIIFDELCLGQFRDESRKAYIRIIGKLQEQGCDAVALVCTEIPLLISADDSPLPILDSTRLLAAAAVDVAIGERPMPEWRGGPPA